MSTVNPAWSQVRRRGSEPPGQRGAAQLGRATDEAVAVVVDLRAGTAANRCRARCRAIHEPILAQSLQLAPQPAAALEQLTPLARGGW